MVLLADIVGAARRKCNWCCRCTSGSRGRYPPQHAVQMPGDKVRVQFTAASLEMAPPSTLLHQVQLAGAVHLHRDQVVGVHSVQHLYLLLRRLVQLEVER